MSNPVIERTVGEYAINADFDSRNYTPLTLDAVVNKALLSAIVVAFGAISGWVFAPQLGFGTVVILAMFGLVLGLVNSFKKQVSPLLVLGYSLVQGLFAGALSFNLNLQYPGIAQQAFLGASVTFGTILTMYALRIVRSGPKFIKFMQFAVISYAMFALVSFGFAMFGFNDGWGLYGGSMGLLFAGIGVVLATLSLIADFSLIEQSIQMKLPESESWRLAFGLTVTFIWLYIELLRLLALLARSNE